MRTEGQLRSGQNRFSNPRPRPTGSVQVAKAGGRVAGGMVSLGVPIPFPVRPDPSVSSLPRPRAGSRRDPKSLGTRGRCREGALPGGPGRLLAHRIAC